VIITVLTRNRINFTKATISAFLGHNKSSKDYTWIALDGASTDGTQQYLKEKGLFTEIIEEKENSGLHPGMKKLFERALEIAPDEEYLFHLENDYWATASADFSTAQSVLDEKEEAGVLQLREIEDEYDQVKKYNPELWHEKANTIKHLARLNKNEPITWFYDFKINGRNYSMTDWHWVNNPTISRRKVIENIFDGVNFELPGSIEFQLMKRYDKMGLKTIRDKPGCFITFGFIQVGNRVSKTPGAKYV